AGAFIPISSFGNTLVTAAIADAEKTGFIGIFTGVLKTVSAGVSSAIIFGFISAIIFKPKG
ncbi:TPA: SpoVA/SpoVAEb family sporulation membrane protein, partial [Clostridium botulinum]|nr:SpoVA/SpoVAEb family sporulation membrane protein [Clostridium botulinum]